MPCPRRATGAVVELGCSAAATASRRTTRSSTAQSSPNRALADGARRRCRRAPKSPTATSRRPSFSRISDRGRCERGRHCSASRRRGPSAPAPRDGRSICAQRDDGGAQHVAQHQHRARGRAAASDRDQTTQHDDGDRGPRQRRGQRPAVSVATTSVAAMATPTTIRATPRSARDRSARGARRPSPLRRHGTHDPHSGSLRHAHRRPWSRDGRDPLPTDRDNPMLAGASRRPTPPPSLRTGLDSAMPAAPPPRP